MPKISRKLILLSLIICAAAILPSIFLGRTGHKHLIMINKFADHPALNAVSDGVQKALRENINSVIIEDQDAQGSVSNAFQIAKNQAANNPTAMIGIATPSAQSALKARINSDVILSFAAVTDSKAANLEDAFNVVGVTDKPEVEKLIAIVAKIFPDKKRMGVIFNPSEINSVGTIARLKKACADHGIEVIEAPVNASSNIKIAMQKLVGESDVVYIPQDNMVVSSIDLVAQVSAAHNTPLVSNDDTYLDKGILLALGTNYFESGVKLGKMIAEQIRKRSTANNIQDVGGTELKVNYKLLEQYGLENSIIDSLQELKR